MIMEMRYMHRRYVILHKKHMKNCLPFVAMEIIDRCFKLNGLDHLPSTK